MLPLRGIKKATLILMLSQLAVSFLTFLTYRIILSTFTKEEFGAFFLVQQIGTLVLICFVEAGMTTVVLGMVAQSPEQEGKIVATLFKMRFVFWCGASILLAIIGWSYGADTLPMFELWAIFSLMGARAQLLRGVLEIHRKSLSDQIPPSLSAVLDAVLLLTFVWFDRQHLTSLSLLLWFVLSTIPGFIWLLLMDNHWKTIMLPFDTETAHKILQLSLPLLFIVLMQQMHGTLEPLLLDYFCNKSEVAVYGAAFRLMSQSFIFVVAFGGSLVPAVARFYIQDKERCHVLILNAVRITMIVGIAFALFSSVLIKPLIYLSSGDRYLDNTTEFWLFAWTVVCGFPQVLLLTLTTAFHWQRRNYIVFGVMLIVGIIGNFAFAPMYQALGAIIAKTVSYLVSSIFAFRILADFSGIRATWHLVLRWTASLLSGACVSWFLLQNNSPLLFFFLTIPALIVIVSVTGLISVHEYPFIGEWVLRFKHNLKKQPNNQS